MSALVRAWPFIVGALALAAFAGLYFAYQNAASQAEALRIENGAIKAELAGVERRNVALEKASAERAVDDSKTADMTKGFTDEIAKAASRAPAATPGPATVALGCERMRQAGRTSADAYRRVCGGR